MKKRLLQRMITAALTGILCMSNALPAAAESLLDKVQSTETDANHAKDVQYSLLRGNHLNFGVSEITYVSGHTINVYAFTQCHHFCDTVYLEMYLEQKNGSSYSSYKDWSFSAYDTESLTRSINVIVPGGHYYRLRGYHAASNGSYEAVSTVTDGIWVD